jgi:uncharacterized protein (DUF1697 family)
MLRGVNVGGKILNMTELRKLYESTGACNVRTYIQSGNVVFDSNEDDIRELEVNTVKSIREYFGYNVNVLIRTKRELQDVIEKMPFSEIDTNKLHVTFLHSAPLKLPIDEIENTKNGAEKFFVAGREIYLYCPNGYGVTKLSNGFFEKKLKVTATTRNWKTVNTLFSMACD